MKRQDLYPYDSAIVGLQDLYIDMGNDAFYVNSANIIAQDKVVSVGRSYLLIANRKDDLLVEWVTLVDVFYDNVLLHILLHSKETGKQITIVHDLKGQHTRKRWLLIDWQYLQAEIDRAEVMKYCGC